MGPFKPPLVAWDVHRGKTSDTEDGPLESQHNQSQAYIPGACGFVLVSVLECGAEREAAEADRVT